jgi:hypothetical protein
MVKTEGLSILIFVTMQRNVGLDMEASLDQVDWVSSVFGACGGRNGNPLLQVIISDLTGFSQNSDNPPRKITTRGTTNNLYLNHMFIKILKKLIKINYLNCFKNI